MVRSVAVRSLILAAAALALACGGGDSSVGGGGGVKKDAGTGTGGGTGGGSGGGNACSAFIEVCNNQDDNCNGMVDEGFDTDGDGVSSCAGDCDDTDATIKPGATETLNGKDDDCDGKVDNKISGRDFDGDGYAYGTGGDCNDEEPLVGPGAIEVQTFPDGGAEGVDNNCNGTVDEPATAVNCEGQITGTTPLDFLRSIELCIAPSQTPTFTGNSAAVSIRPRLGCLSGSGTCTNTTPWSPKAGARMLMLSSGRAQDNASAAPLGSATFTPQQGSSFSTTQVGNMLDLAEVTVILKAPQNAKSFSFDFAFFSAEFPEYVGFSFNDAFEAELISSALPTSFAASNCANGQPGCRRGNVSFDGTGKRVSVNNNYFTICQRETTDMPRGGPTVTALCAANTISQLNGTGYETVKSDTFATRPVGGGTGWLSTKAPVKPGELIQLKFRVYDESDRILDSAALIDNFKWEATAVSAPTTAPIN